MPKRILEDGRVVLTKDEFVQMMLRDQKRRKLKRQREELELYGSLDDLDFPLDSEPKNTVKDDFDIDELIREVGIEVKEISDDFNPNLTPEKIENKVKEKPIKVKKESKKVTKKAKETSTLIEKAITSKPIQTFELKGIATKDGNEQLSFAF